MSEFYTNILAMIILIVYSVAMLFIFLYSLVQGHLTLIYWVSKRRKDDAKKKVIEKEFPMVTVQLPIYNELYVVERLIDCVSQLDYPKDKFEIQVLDDSTDETVEIIKRKVESIRRNGINIVHIRRESRAGYKAGALAHGLLQARGEFIAIFDADFLPGCDFLLKTLPYFEDEKVGLVQTRWGYLNEDYSLLTRLQAFGLDAHFTVEQKGRNKGGYFINFNGTAGIWRKTCIVDAGGWHSDTLTEDLDLSYRAQLKGWKFVYVEDIENPSELPILMSALKSQQYRWTKGAAECAKKNLIALIQSKSVSWFTKVHGLFHLLNSSVFVSILIILLFSIPLLYIKNHVQMFGDINKYNGVFLINLFPLLIFYYTALFKKKGNWISAFVLFLIKFPLFLSISMGLSLHNTISVMEGYIGKKTPFIRTPKFSSFPNWKANKYIASAITPLTVFEGLLGMYFLSGIFFAIHWNDFSFIVLHSMAAFGFLVVCLYSFIHSIGVK